MDQYINEILANLNGSISASDLDAVRKALIMASSKWDVTLKEKSMIPWMPTTPECYKAFMVTKKIEGASMNSLRLYELYLKDLFAHVTKPIDTLSANDIRAYLYDVQNRRKISNRSLDGRRAVLSTFFGWISAEGYIPSNPMLTIKKIKYTKPEQDSLSDAQLEQIRYACETIRDKAVIEVFYSTGCRLSELIILNKKDIDYITGEVTLFGKGSKYRTAWLSNKALLYLKKYYESRNDDNDAVFVSDRIPHNRICPATIEQRLHAIGKKAGVPNLHPHLIRHTTATNALQHGMDITMVQKLLGHTSLDTTMIYAKVDTSSLASNCHKYIT